MATLSNRQNGNFTAASTWGIVDPVSLLNNATNSNVTTTSYVESSTFTPGAITIDALALNLNGVAINSGTFSVRLALGGVTVSGTEVTINVADINANTVGWTLFRLAAPVTLLAATAYTISVRSSVASTVSVFRNPTAGNWNRFLRTTTTSVPLATDVFFVTGQHTSPGVNSALTVTCDNTAATVFGGMEIGEKGIFTAATTAATAFQIRLLGNVFVRGNATLQLGTLADPIPASSSFIFQINQGGINVNFGLTLTANGIFRTYGAAKIGRALLTADAAVAATSLTTNVATGWLSGDEIAIAPTTNVPGQLEARTLSANAVGTTVTVPALTFAHQGTGDFVAELGNLTRNVKIQSDSATFGTYIINSGASVVDLNFTEFREMGSATANRRGFDVLTSTGSFNMNGCALHRFQATAFGLLINQASNNNITILDTVLYLITSGIQTAAAITGTNFTFTNVWTFNAPVLFGHPGGTISGLVGTGSGATPISFVATANLGLLITNIVAHGNTANGIAISTATQNPQLFSNLRTWRNLRGINPNGSSNVLIDGHVAYGNSIGIAVSNCVNLVVENSTYYGSTASLQPNGVVCEITSFNTTFNNCSFGFPTTHLAGDVNFSNPRAWHDVKFNNCLFNSTTEVSSLFNLPQNALISSARHDQTAGVHRAWRRTATLSSDSVIQSSPPRSLRLTPSVAAQKTPSPLKGFAIPAGLTATVTVTVRRSVAGDGTAYNGALPRLWLRQNNSAGIANDILLATATAASLGQFEVLTGVIPAATDNTVNYVYVDLDGTAGWVNIDRWTLSINGGTANATNLSTEDFWQDGLPFLGVNTTLTVNTNQETYWLDGVPVQQLYPTSTLQTGRFFAFFQ